jgi:uncharacterized protein (DUF433 family)
MATSRLAAAKLTVPEAAFVAGVSERAIHHEIDARILRPIGRAERRTISGDDLLYLAAIRGVREHLAPPLRRQLRDAVSAAARNDQRVAKVAAFEVPLQPIEAEILCVLAKLESLRSRLVASDPRVLAGEPVLRGTRIAARLVADLIKKGIPREQIAAEYDLTAEQIEAAVVFDRVTPKRGRPPRRRQPAHKRLHVTKHDVPAAG